MPDVLLATLNARYAHAAFGLRYLLANLGPLRPRAELLEATIQDTPLSVVEAVLRRNPGLVGLSVYLWNAGPTLEVVRLLKRLRPDLPVVLGGPEVSHEWEQQEIVRLADAVVLGEGEAVLPELCERLLRAQPLPCKAVPGGLPDLARLELPYELYSEQDLGSRVVYVEASRGCPFSCEFCLSSLDAGVRAFPLERFLEAMQGLLERGARHFKFIDRTFNLKIPTSRAILEFFLERYRPGMFLHFEMIPDRFPEPLREVVRRFEPGALQLEVGVQTFDPEVSARISRRQDYHRLADNLTFLRGETGVHVHADLIVGLPGEDLASFGRGFDRLCTLGPQEIQVGLLKRLRGTPIARHDAEFGMVYSPSPPYEVLRTAHLSFEEVMRMRRFARYWDLVGNRGFFTSTLQVLLGESPFHSFLAFSDWLYEKTRATHALALDRLGRLLGEYVADLPGVAEAMQHDCDRAGRSLFPGVEPQRARRSAPEGIPARQARHLSARPG